MNPNTTPNKLKIRLREMFKNPSKYCESLSKFKVSIEKEEKVVSPPQNPIAIRNLRLLETSSFSANPKIKMPIIKLPKKFAASVPNGKITETFSAKKTDKKYLKLPPKPAPMKT